MYKKEVWSAVTFLAFYTSLVFAVFAWMLGAKIDPLAQNINRMDQRIGRVEQRMDSLEQRINLVEQRIDRMEVEQQNFKERMTRLESNMVRMEAKLDRILIAQNATRKKKGKKGAKLKLYKRKTANIK